MPFDFTQMESEMTEIDFDSELDAFERAQKFSDNFNLAGDEEDLPLSDKGWPVGGIEEAQAATLASEDDHLNKMLAAVLAEHDRYTWPGNPDANAKRWKHVIDPCLDDEGNRTLDKWNPADPKQSNVV